MISMVKFIDANIFIQRWSNPQIAAFLNTLNPEEHATSVLVLAEVYDKMELKKLTHAFSYIRGLMGALTVFPIIQDDLFWAIKNPLPLRINDRLHLAVMKRNNVQVLISYDADFDHDKSMIREEL